MCVQCSSTVNLKWRCVTCRSVIKFPLQSGEAARVMQSSSFRFRLASAPELPYIVQRSDGNPTTLLRCRPHPARTCDVWVKGNPMVSQGETVTVIRMNAANEEGFAWVRTESGVEGFLRSEYVTVAPQRAAAPEARRPEVLWKAGKDPLTIWFICRLIGA